MASRPAASRTLLASVNTWWKASKALPGFTGDLEAWACATLGVTLEQPEGPSLGDLAGPDGERWVQWTEDGDKRRSALVARLLATMREAEERSPEWWAARLLSVVLHDQKPAFAHAFAHDQEPALAEAAALIAKMESQMDRERNAKYGALGGRPSKMSRAELARLVALPASAQRREAERIGEAEGIDSASVLKRISRARNARKK